MKTKVIIAKIIMAIFGIFAITVFIIVLVYDWRIFISVLGAIIVMWALFWSAYILGRNAAEKKIKKL